jgi:hypothetical protein
VARQKIVEIISIYQTNPAKTEYFFQMEPAAHMYDFQILIEGEGTEPSPWRRLKISHLESSMKDLESSRLPFIGGLWVNISKIEVIIIQGCQMVYF